MTITYDDDGTEIVATYCYNDLSSNITVCVFAKKETKNVTACRDYVLQAGLVSKYKICRAFFFSFVNHFSKYI